MKYSILGVLVSLVAVVVSMMFPDTTWKMGALALLSVLVSLSSERTQTAPLSEVVLLILFVVAAIVDVVVK